jgi:cullin-4
MKISRNGSDTRSGGLKKKLVIVPFKQKPKLPDNFEASTWKILEAAIHAVNTKVSVVTPKEELYRAVEDLCMHKMAPSTYEKLAIECSNHIASKISALNRSVLDGSDFLGLVDSTWQDHCHHMIIIRNIFLYLDRSYALNTPRVLSIWDLGLRILQENFKKLPDIQMKVIDGLLTCVEMERQGNMVDREMMHRIVQMLVFIDLYHGQFEKVLLIHSQRFFHNEGLEMAENMDTSVFLSHTEKRLLQANEMVAEYLDTATRIPLLRTIEDELLRPHVEKLIDPGLKVLLDENRLPDLRRMYCLMDRIQQLEPMKKSWSAYIKSAGVACVQDESRDKNMIEDLIALQEKFGSVLLKAFCNHDGFKAALKSSGEHFINVRPNKPAELLARFIDKKMRGGKGVTDLDIENAMEDMMTLFRYLNGKDTFEAFYKRILAKRLLLNKSASMESEYSMLTKLKSECGAKFTSKLEGMLKDMTRSKEIMSMFRSSSYHPRAKGDPISVATDGYNNECNNGVDSPREDGGSGSSSSSSGSSSSSSSGMDAEFHVLTMGYWPTPAGTDVLVPPELKAYRDSFADFHGQKYQGRKLTWVHSLDRCIVTARFPKGRKELDLSFYQTIVLQCFNEAKHGGVADPDPSSSTSSSASGPRLTIAKVRQATNIEDQELRRTLLSLACGMIGTRVLVKEPKGKDVADSDVFSFNGDFSNKLFRIKINSIHQKEVQEEIERTHDEVFRDRQHQVDAVLVRTMKARKTLEHNQLMSEIMEQLKFPAQAQDIKKRIESLIEREYLERDAKDRSIYNYLA